MSFSWCSSPSLNDLEEAVVVVLVDPVGQEAAVGVAAEEALGAEVVVDFPAAVDFLVAADLQEVGKIIYLIPTSHYINFHTAEVY